MLNHELGGKSLTVAQLLQVLNTLDSDMWVTVNEVGNLMITDAKNETYLGYIDFLFEGSMEWNSL